MFAQVINGRETWHPRTTVPRHRHDRAYAALVLSGGYEECGSRGRFRVGPGDVLLHGAFDAHLDRFENRETVILDLKFPHRIAFALGCIDDVDAVVRLAEKDAEAAGTYVCEQIVPKKMPSRDWRDALADLLLENPNTRLDAWADEQRLSPETLSRGFGRTFGVTPASFRAEARAHRAFALVSTTATTSVCYRGGRWFFRPGSHDPRRESADRTGAALLAEVKFVQDRRLTPPFYSRMTDAAIEPPRFRLKLIPLIVVVALGLGIPILGASAAIFTAKILHWQITPGANPPWLYVQHFYQTALALLAIVVLKFWLVSADYGLHMPREKSYVWPAIWWGIFFGVLMTVVDYAPQLIHHTKPDAGYPLTPQNVWSWLFFEGVYVGPTEEIPFRALLVTYLAATMPGKFRVGRFEMNWAGVLVALIFALAHATNFSTRWWPLALGQQVYAFALGVLYAYWLEKSKSVLAPAIGHNVGDVVETGIMMAWIAFL